MKWSGWRTLIPLGVVGVAASVLIVYAVNSAAFPMRDVDLHDSGVWVTNNAADEYGRMNLTAGGLDGYLTPGATRSGNLDVFQDGASVVARDVATGRLIPVDPLGVANVIDGVVAVAPDDPVALSAGSVAAVDVKTGSLRATRYTPGDIPVLSALDPAIDALADLGRPPADVPTANASSVAVGVDGTIHAVSTSGQSATVRQDGAYSFGRPDVAAISGSLKGVRATAVGDQLVYLDPVTGVVYLPGGATVTLPDGAGAVPQAPGPASASVFVATRSSLLAVPMAGGNPITLGSGDAGTPAQPVVVGGYVYAAWSGDPGRLVAAPADAGDAALPIALDRNKTLVAPVFRVNHGRVVLNDMANGLVFDMESMRSLDNWDQVRTPDDSAKERTRTDQLQDSQPAAQPDHLGARPGRTTVLHVLDNDSDPGGNILAITALDAPAAGSSVAISADAQTVLFTAPPDATSTSFTYTVSNGTGEATARVDVELRADGTNEPPALRQDFTPVVYPVAPGATTAIFVAQDWRDPDGDPVSVASASVAGVPVPVTPEGAIRYTAPRTAVDSPVTIDYLVSDGHADTQVAGTITVRIPSPGDTQGIPPVAQADMVRARAGQPVSFFPLANDIPGVDPLDPAATLSLAGSVASPTGLDVVTDLASGMVTATASAAGTYYLDYTAACGAAAYSPGRIRIDVTDAGSPDPMTAPDHVTVRGTVPATVDVLANDADPGGAVLSVIAVQPEDPDQVAAAAVSGRWIRITPLNATMSPNPQVVHYTATNGRGASVQGDIVVTQLSPPELDTLILADDTATVRSGDSALIDVLANDASQSGKTLLLSEQPAPDRPAGELPVVVVGASATPTTTGAQPAGRAFVVGNRIRYIAPLDVTEPFQAAVTYTATTADGGSPQSATLIVRVVPEPTEQSPDAPPAPLPVEARGVPGEKITLPIQIYGVDPDGDSVTVAGITTLPRLGRVTAITPTSITYEGFPDAANLGTDTFNYLVTDRYGLTGVARVRIGLVPPGTFPPSVALDDTVTAQPGADVTVQPLTNDLIAAGDDPQVVPLDAELPDGVHLSTDVFAAVAPDDGAPPVQFSYLLRGAGGDGPPAVVTVRSQTGFLNPPKLTDSVATIDGDTAGAAPLANAWDIDGPPSGIHLVSIAAGTPAADGTVSGIPLADHIQALPFIAADADGATSAAIVFVPAAGAGAPQVRTDVGTIEMSANSTLTVNLSDYVFSPSGRQVRITVADSLAAAPGSGLSVQAASPTAITLTSQNDYVGPAAIGVEVTDGVDATDPDARRAFLTIPVQIGPNTPVLRCPAGVQEVVQGGADKILDITALCHVWTSDTVTRDTLAYTADWASPLADVAAAGGRVVTLSAAGRAVAGAEAPLQVGIAGTEATPQTLTVRVVAAGRPRLSVPDLTDIQQGASVRQRIALSSPLRDAVPTVVSVTQTAGPPCQVTSVTGDHFTLTPGADVHGTMTFAVVASDLADPSRTERQVRGTFTMTVFGRPDPPTPPAPGSQLLTHAVALTWSPGPDNGAAIDEYQVQASDGRFTQSCGRATRCDVTGVPNGTPIAFQTRSHNLGGWSDWSAPGPSFTPNETPGVATAFTATDPQNQQLTLTWKPAPVDGSPVTVYHLTWTGGAVGSLDLPGDATSATVTGLINNAPYAFKLVAENAAGRSPLSATTNGQSSGAPLGLAPPTITPQDLGDTTQVTVTWVAADPNGPGPVTYQVTRTGGAVGTKTFAPTTSLTLGDSIAYDGQTYTYTVTAVNGTGGPAHTSAAQQASFVAIGAPANWAAGAVAVVPTGQNGQVDLTFTYPPSRGASSRVELAWGGAASGTRTVPNLSTSGGTSSFRLTGLPNGTNLDATFQVCNEHACNGNKASASGSAFGPLATPKLQTQARSTNGDAGVCAKASGDGNGRNATLRLTATGPGGLNATTDVGTGAAALASPDWWCVDAGAGNRTVTFGATLITATTNPARTNSASATAQQRSPNDPPAPWPAGAVTLTPTGNNGELLLSLNYPNSNGNQARIEVTWPGGSKTLTSINPSGGTTSLTITGLPNGVPASVTVLLCNEEVCSATPGQSPAAAPFGPLAPPTITAQAGRNGDHKLCATAIGDGNGAEARLTITASTGASSPVQTGAGGLTVTWCPDVGGPNKTVTFTATLTSSTTPPRANPTAPTATATTPLDPPDAWAANPITLTPTGNIGELGATVVYPACNGASCKVTITWSGAASGSFTIDPATTGGGRWAKTFTGLPSGTNLTMSATVCNEQVCGPVSPTATGAAFGPPAAWAAGAITLTPTGTNGELAAVVTYPACHGNGCTVTITWTGAASGSQTVSPAEAGGGTWRKTIAGLANGANLTISAQVCNDKLCGDTSPTATNSAFGPLAPPTLNVYAHGGAGDHLVCATASGNGNGRDATIAMTASNGTSNNSSTGSGALSLGPICIDVGASGTGSFSAWMKSSSTTPARADSSVATGSAKTQADPPPPASVTVAWGNKGSNQYCNTAACKFIKVSAKNLSPNTTYKVEYVTDCAGNLSNSCPTGGMDPFTTTSVKSTSSGTLTDGADNSGRIFGYPGAHVWVRITLNGKTLATSNKITC